MGATGVESDCERFIRAVYDEHGDALRRFAARLLGRDWIKAEDILQEAAIRAWRHTGLLARQGKDEVRPWLFTVVRNLVIDEHRARLVRPVSAGTVDDLVIPVDDGIERALTRQVVHDTLDDLTPQQRQILHHTYFRGHSVAETAQVLGIAQGTVKSRTYYALRALRSALHNRGVRS
ncbi:sigma-70 family RNA polymerase sigma factor [Streptomyces achromogenes]|uniref:sigma-70 family RNA polymerase sigma factor n=1 Tax=Streptomyces achromogenes TaxID=67255 RepID=UPI0036FDAFDC